jgi:signal transduction histidine kinase
MISFRHIPIRLRLSLWYTMLTAVVLVIFSFALYVGLERQLSTTLDQDLRNQAALASTSITYAGGLAIVDPAFTDQLSDVALLWAINFDTGKVVKVRGDTLDVEQLLEEDLARAQFGTATYRTIRVNKQRLRVLTFPALNQYGNWGSAVQLGYSTRRVDNALDLLLKTLLVVATLAILVAACIGYLLAGRALQPVAKITRLASQVDGNDLDARLNLDLPQDELGRLASTFDSMLERIDQAFRRQRQFTGDAAHELRTPLSLMRSQIDLALTQAETPAEFQEALSALDGDVSRMTTLVGMLLSLARADAGQLTPNREPVDLSDLALDVADQLEPIASENGLTIETDLRPVTATVDADMIIQVLVNLIDNAITNTPSGGTITVKVDGGQASMVGSSSASVKASENGKAKSAAGTDLRPVAILTVSDTGIGIPPQHLPRIFDRFYRVDTGRARSHGGIGLGLAICQAIVHAHHGTLTATSTPGRGSTFTMTMPVEGVEKPGTEARAPSPRAQM